MPLYEFSCPNCHHKFETICPAGTTGEDIQCPVCKEYGVKKLLSSFRAIGSSKGGGDSSGGCSACSSSSCSSCGH